MPKRASAYVPHDRARPNGLDESRQATCRPDAAEREARLNEIVARIRSGMLEPTTSADAYRILYGEE